MYVEGERLQHVGEVPSGIRFIVSGSARMVVEAAGGVRVPVVALARGAILGLTSLTRQGINTSVDKIDETTMLFVPVDVVDELVPE